MPDSSTDRTQHPDRSPASAQQAQPLQNNNAAGDAILDGQIAADQNQPEGEPIDYPIASNFTTATTADQKTADVSTVSGPYSTDQPSGQSVEAGTVHLQNNPHIPDGPDPDVVSGATLNQNDE